MSLLGRIERIYESGVKLGLWNVYDEMTSEAHAITFERRYQYIADTNYVDFRETSDYFTVAVTLSSSFMFGSSLNRADLNIIEPGPWVEAIPAALDDIEIFIAYHKEQKDVEEQARRAAIAEEEARLRGAHAERMAQLAREFRDRYCPEDAE